MSSKPRRVVAGLVVTFTIDSSMVKSKRARGSKREKKRKSQAMKVRRKTMREIGGKGRGRGGL